MTYLPVVWGVATATGFALKLNPADAEELASPKPVLAELPGVPNVNPVEAVVLAVAVPNDSPSAELAGVAVVVLLAAGVPNDSPVDAVAPGVPNASPVDVVEAGVPSNNPVAVVVVVVDAENKIFYANLLFAI